MARKRNAQSPKNINVIIPNKVSYFKITRLIIKTITQTIIIPELSFSMFYAVFYKLSANGLGIAEGGDF